MKDVYVVLVVRSGRPDDPLVYTDEKKADRKFRRLLEEITGEDLDDLTEEQVDALYEEIQANSPDNLWLFKTPVRPTKQASARSGSSPRK